MRAKWKLSSIFHNMLGRLGWQRTSIKLYISNELKFLEFVGALIFHDLTKWRKILERKMWKILLMKQTSMVLEFRGLIKYTMYVMTRFKLAYLRHSSYIRYYLTFLRLTRKLFGEDHERQNRMRYAGTNQSRRQGRSPTFFNLTVDKTLIYPAARTNQNHLKITFISPSLHLI